MVAAYTSRFGSGRLGEGRFGGSGRPFVPDVTGPWASAILAGPQSGLVLPVTALELDENAIWTRYVVTTAAQPSITAQQVFDGEDQTGAAAAASGTLALTIAAPSAAADLPVDYTGDVHVTIVLIDGAGNRSAPTAVGPVSVNTATPSFLTQPAFDAPGYLAGATASWSMGTGTAGASITLKTFTLDGSDRLGEISGTTWDTTGEARGKIALRARATNDVTGLFALSDVITADVYELPAVMAAPAVSAAGANALSVALASAPDDGGQPITGYDLRYSTDEANWTVIGDVSDPQDITGLAPGTLFHVQTRASNIGGAGGWSASGAAATSAGGDVIAPSVSLISAGAQSGVGLPLTATGLSEDAAMSRYVVTTIAQPSITAQQVFDGEDQTGAAAAASGAVGLTPAQPVNIVSLPVDYTGDIHVTIVLIDGAGNRSAPVAVGPVSVNTATPSFLAQPTLDATDLLSGATITRSVGTAPAGTTITVEQFTLNGADKEPDVTGNAWDSTGEVRGTLVFQCRATNDVTGLFALSDVITADVYELPAVMAAPAVSAAGANALSVALAAAPDDGGKPITGYDLRYSTDQSNWTVIGDVSDPQSITGLAPGTLFHVQTRASNIGGAGGWSASGAAATSAGGDVIAPVVSSVSYDAGTRTLSLSIIEDSGSVTVYWAGAANPDTPSEAQVRAGAGGGILEAGSFVTNSGATAVSLTNTNINELHLVVEDGAGNSTGTPASGNNTLITGIDMGGTGTDPAIAQSISAVADSKNTSAMIESGPVIVGSGANRMLVAMCAVYAETHGQTLTPSATFGTPGRPEGSGTAMTAIPLGYSESRRVRAYAFALPAPVSGSGTVQFSPGGDRRGIGLKVYELTDVDQNTANILTGYDFVVSGTSATAAVTTTGANSIVLGGLVIQSGTQLSGLTASGGQTQDEALATGGSNYSDATLAWGHKAVASAGADSAGWSRATSNDAVCVRVAFEAV